VANTDTGKPVDTLTRFGAASLDKPLVAYAALKLADRGLLDLDRPLMAYAPYPDLAGDPRAARITARHVLSHSSGLPNWRRAGSPLRTAFEPGQRFSYSGEGLAMLEATISALLGRPIEQWLSEEVLGPLGLTQTHLGLPTAARDRAASGHDPDGTPSGDGLRPSSSSIPFPAPLFTTASDYGAFLAASLQGEGLSPAMRIVARTPVVPLGADCLFNCAAADSGDHSPDNFWGLGWGIEASRTGRVTLWQWGDNGRYQAFAAGDPERGIGFVLLTNGATGTALRQPLLDLVLPGTHPGLAWLERQYARLAARAGR